MNFYLEKVNERDKDTLYRLLLYSLFEESAYLFWKNVIVEYTNGKSEYKDCYFSL